MSLIGDAFKRPIRPVGLIMLVTMVCLRGPQMWRMYVESRQQKPAAEVHHVTSPTMLEVVMNERLNTWVWGYIDRSGQVKFEVQSDSPGGFQQGYATILQNGRWHMMNTEGRMITQPFYLPSGAGPITGFESIQPFSEGLAAVQYNSRYGYINEQGQVMIPLTFHAAGPFSEGLAAVQMDDERRLDTVWGYLDPSGQVVLRLERRWRDANAFRDGLACVMVPKETVEHLRPKDDSGTRYGTSPWMYAPAMIDRTGKIVSSPHHSSCEDSPEEQRDVKWPYSYTLAPAEEQPPCGYADKGAGMIKRRLDHTLGFTDGRPIRFGAQWSYVDIAGRTREPIEQSRAQLRLTKELGMRQAGTGTWEYLIWPRFDRALWFSEGLAGVGVGNGCGTLGACTYGYINEAGQEVIPPQFDYGWMFFDGRALIGQGTSCGSRTYGRGHCRYGYIDPTGRYAVEPTFDWAVNFSEGLAVVETGGKWGYIDPSGRYAIPQTFDWAWDFTGGVALVGVGADCAATNAPHCTRYYIDKTGARVPEPSHAEPVKTHEADKRLAVIDYGNTFGYVDTTGKILKPQLDTMLGFTDGQPVRIDGQWRYADLSGAKSVVPEQFGESLRFSEEFRADGLWGGTAWSYRLTPRFRTCGRFSDDGIAFVQVGERWGLIDASGVPIFPPTFTNVSGEFSNGLLAVQVGAREETSPDDGFPILVGGKWGYVDREGVFIIEPQFDGAREFSGGLAAVQVGKEWGYIDPEGRIVIKPQFHDAHPFSGAMAAVKLRKVKRP